jgi:hypothetical protein
MADLSGSSIVIGHKEAFPICGIKESPDYPVMVWEVINPKSRNMSRITATV